MGDDFFFYGFYLSVFHYYILVSCIPFYALFDLRKRYFQSIKKQEFSLISEGVLNSSLLILFLYSFNSFDILTVSILFFISLLIVFVLTSYFIYIFDYRKLQSLKSDKKDAKVWTQMGFIMSIGAVSQILIARSDLLVLGLFADSNTVADYSIAYRISLLLSFPIMIMNSVFGAELAKLNHLKNKNRLLYRYISLCLFSGFFSMVGFVVIYNFSTEIISFFGEEYYSASRYLKILSIGQLCLSFFGPLGLFMIMVGLEKQFSITTVVFAILSIILFFLFIPDYSGIGASVISVCCIIAMALTQIFFIVKFFRNYIEISSL